MRIGVDLDGVVYNFVDDYRQWLNKSTGKPLEEMPDAATWNFFKDQWGMTTAEYVDQLNRGVGAGAVFRRGSSIPGARANLAKLMARGHELHIVTNRPQQGAVDSTLRWLAANQIPLTSLTFAADKTSVPTDVFVEDNVENFLALEQAGVRAVLFDQKWNRHHSTPYRVKSWKDFVDFIAAWDESLLAAA